jgi:hypothetical protein
VVGRHIGNVDAQDIALFKQLLQANGLGVLIPVIRLVFIIGDDAGFEAGQALGEGVAHIAIAQDADCFPFDFQAPVGFSFPKPLTNFPVGPAQMIHQHQKHAQRMLSYGIPASLGGIKDGNPSLCSIFPGQYAPFPRRTVQ